MDAHAMGGTKASTRLWNLVVELTSLSIPAFGARQRTFSPRHPRRPPQRWNRGLNFGTPSALETRAWLSLAESFPERRT